MQKEYIEFRCRGPEWISATLNGFSSFFVEEEKLSAFLASIKEVHSGESSPCGKKFALSVGGRYHVIKITHHIVFMGIGSFCVLWDDPDWEVTFVIGTNRAPLIRALEKLLAIGGDQEILHMDVLRRLSELIQTLKDSPEQQEEIPVEAAASV